MKINHDPPEAEKISTRSVIARNEAISFLLPSVLIPCSLAVAIFQFSFAFAGHGLQIADVQKRYEEIQTFTSSFTQKTYHDEEMVQEFKGKIIAERPNKFRMEVKKPEKQLILSDGEGLWIYLPKEKRALKMNPEEGLTMPVEMFFNPFEVYQVEWFEEEKKKPLLEVRPREEGTLFEKAWVQIHPKTLLVREIQLFDTDGNQIHYTFSKVRINRKVKPSTFQFEPPKGVEVIER